ncbi:hypothetical protein [Pontibacter sp. H249]|uniref:hypothetical protein n=1 Tax=Pontibacter sp. H249 TaxID=3133420 RepID=UPI0030C12698
MILFSNGLILLDYNPADDILSVELPDMQEMTLPEVRRSFQIVIENIINYDIKNLLLDSSKAIVEVEDEEYKAVILQFGTDLMRTRLQRLARVGSTRPVQEKRAANVSEEVKQELNLPIKFGNFTIRADAMNWLKGMEA